MGFDNYVKRANSVKDMKTFDQFSQERQVQFRFSVKNNKMILEEMQKSKFAQVIDKRYYFILEEKQNLLLMEKKALLKNHRLFLLINIFLQEPRYYQVIKKEC